MSRSTPLFLVILLAGLGCGAAPAADPSTPTPTAEPPSAPADEPESTSGTVDDGSGPAMVTQNSATTTAPAADVLDKEGIRRVIRTEIAAVLACYEEGLGRRPELAGKVTVSFQIEATGSVSTASASGLGDAQVETCVASVIEGLRFPPGEDRGTIVVNYPFTLRPKPD